MTAVSNPKRKRPERRDERAAEEVWRDCAHGLGSRSGPMCAAAGGSLHHPARGQVFRHESRKRARVLQHRQVSTLLDHFEPRAGRQ